VRASKNAIPSRVFDFGILSRRIRSRRGARLDGSTAQRTTSRLLGSPKASLLHVTPPRLAAHFYRERGVENHVWKKDGRIYGFIDRWIEKEGEGECRYKGRQRPKPYTLHSTLYTLHSTLYTVHPTPYTLHLIPCTLNPEHTQATDACTRTAAYFPQLQTARARPTPVSPCRGRRPARHTAYLWGGPTTCPSYMCFRRLTGTFWITFQRKSPGFPAVSARDHSTSFDFFSTFSQGAGTRAFCQ